MSNPALLLLLLPQAGLVDDAPSFEREIRPLLMARCSGCHQPALLEGGLDLTTHAALISGADGEALFNFEVIDESPILESIMAAEGSAPDMPPDGPARVHSGMRPSPRRQHCGV